MDTGTTAPPIGRIGAAGPADVTGAAAPSAAGPSPDDSPASAGIALVRRIGLHHGAQLTIGADGQPVIGLGARTVRVGVPGEWMTTLLRRLVGAELPEEELQTLALAAGGPAGLFRWIETIRRLDGAGLLACALWLGDGRICAIRSAGPGPSDSPPAFDPAAQQRLSRFVAIRVDEGTLVAQHPASHVVVQLGRVAVAVVGMLADWTDWRSIARRLPRAGDIVVRAVLEQFARAGVVEQRQATDQHTGPDAAEQWAFADFWLHARTRHPGVADGWGGSYPGLGRFPHLPAHPPRYPGRSIALPVPQRSASRSLQEVMETRRTIRAHDDENPVTIEQLAELLYRTARTRSVEDTLDGHDQILDRPYPAGGALHELEIYPLVRHCRGVEPGLWHYRNDSHELEWVAGPGGAVDRLMWAAQSAATMNTQPQVVLVISARFGRVMFKYGSIAYALTLKHVGVLLQSLYLVATDLGLAPAAIGSGDSTDFADATGRDPLAEGSVGEFVLGSRPPGIVPGRLQEWGG